MSFYKTGKQDGNETVYLGPKMSQRTDLPRYGVGDVVTVNGSISSRYTGETGVILDRKISAYNRTLDKYTVKLHRGGTAVFWDIQIRGIRDQIANKPGDYE